MEGKKIDLDLHEVELQGWEDFKSAYTVAEYVSKALNGERAPKVEVVYRNGIYEIEYGRDSRRKKDPDYNYGGHKRAIAHRITGISMPALIIPEHRIKYAVPDFFPINEIQLIEGEDIPLDFFRNIQEDVTRRFLDRWQFEIDLHQFDLSKWGIEHLVSSYTTHS